MKNKKNLMHFMHKKIIITINHSYEVRFHKDAFLYYLRYTKKAWPPYQSSWGRIPGCAPHAFVEDIVSHFLKCLINIQPFLPSFRKPIAIMTIPIGKAAIILTLCK